MAKLICDIVTPAAKLFSDEAYMVVVPGVEGEMGYLHGHVPLVSALSDGVVRIQSDKEATDRHRFALQGGYVEVAGDKVIILADRALPVSDIDAAAAREKLGELEAQLAALSEEEARKTPLGLDIAWCKVQIAAVE